jgi:hypothetical protein
VTRRSGTPALLRGGGGKPPRGAKHDARAGLWGYRAMGVRLDCPLPERDAAGAVPRRILGRRYFRCLFTSLVISNMLTLLLPPNTPLSAGSALIMRRFFGSCRSFFLM